MKNLKLIVLAAALALTGCNNCNCYCDGNGNDDFDFTPYYVPHVTILHRLSDRTEHYYSVMLIVKKDDKVYEKSNPSTTIAYNMEYYFQEGRGGTLIKETKSYPLNSKYELRFYEYPISKTSLMALSDSTKSKSTKYDGPEFKVIVGTSPKDHPHTHPDPLHEGTIHRPGVGGGGGGGGVSDQTKN